MLKVRKIEKNKDKTHKHSLSGMPETIFWIFVECLRIIGLIRTFVWLIQKIYSLLRYAIARFVGLKGEVIVISSSHQKFRLTTYDTFLIGFWVPPIPFRRNLIIHRLTYLVE